MAARIRRQYLSYIPTGEGWMYLAAIKDMPPREIVGWSMADRLRGELACDALVMAIQRRQPPRGLIQHSDRGVQYASKPYREILARHGITQSMSRKGDCLDNAPMESFFGSLKNELVHRTTFPTREAARRAIFEYVEAFYKAQLAIVVEHGRAAAESQVPGAFGSGVRSRARRQPR